jgi:hypothetical protein
MNFDPSKYERIDSLRDEEYDYTSDPVRWCGLYQHKVSRHYFKCWFHAKPEWNDRFQELVNEFYDGNAYKFSVIFHDGGIRFPNGFEEFCADRGFHIGAIDLQAEPSEIAKVLKHDTCLV